MDTYITLDILNVLVSHFFNHILFYDFTRFICLMILSLHLNFFTYREGDQIRVYFLARDLFSEHKSLPIDFHCKIKKKQTCSPLNVSNLQHFFHFKPLLPGPRGSVDPARNSLK